MEYYYRCSRCGHRTPSFEYEDYLNDYANDWEISEDKIICDKCIHDEENKHFKRVRMYENILYLVLFVICIICIIIKTFS